MQKDTHKAVMVALLGGLVAAAPLTVSAADKVDRAADKVFNDKEDGRCL